MITNRTALLLSAAPLVSIVILSQLGHKEWRFIIYTLPVLIIAALHGLLSWYALVFHTYAVSEDFNLGEFLQP